MTEQILMPPCPFCGEIECIDAVVLPTTKNDDGFEWGAMRCRICGATGPMAATGIEAKRLWNKRTEISK